MATAVLGGDDAPIAIPQARANATTLCVPAAFAAAPPSATTEACIDNGSEPPNDLLNALSPGSASVPGGDRAWSVIPPTWARADALSGPAASAGASSQGVPDLRPDNPPIPPTYLRNIWAPVSADAPGGNGTWSLASAAWTDLNGDAQTAMSPQPGFAKFEGIPGLVIVDDSAGAVGVTGMRFAVDGYTLAGDALQLSGSAGSLDNIDVGDGTTTSAGYGAAISNALTGSAGLNKVDFGTLSLTGTNTYAGETDINGGTLALAGNGSIADSIGVMIYGSGTFDISGTANGATIRNLENDGSTDGAVVLGGKTLTVNNANGFGFTGTISGTGGLTVSGGWLTLWRAAYTGLTSIDAGAGLQIGFSGKGASIAGNIVDNGTLEFFHSDDVTYGGVISGTGSLIQEGTGKLTLTGANTFSGGTSIVGMANLTTGQFTAGTLAISSDANLGVSSGAVALGGGTLETTASFTLNHPVVLGGGVSSSIGIIGAGGTFQTDAGTTLTVTAPITNAPGFLGSLTKTGAGTLVLTGNNTYQDATTITAGTLVLTGTNTSDNATFIEGGVLQISSDANLGAATSSNGVIIRNGTLRADASFTLSHSVLVGNTATIDTNGHSLTIAGVISDDGSGQGVLVKEGAGTLIMQLIAGPAWASTSVEAGTLALSNPSVLAGPVSISSGATFDISQYSGMSVNSSVPALNGNGTVALGSNALDIVGSVSWIFGGVIADGGMGGGVGGNVDFYGSNSTATLTGANTYTGTTTIENGTLALVGSGSIANSSLVVVGDAGNSGTLDISGTSNGTTIRSLSGGVTGPGAVVLGGKTLTVSDAANDFGGVISGTGGLVLSAGTLTLDSDNTYTGGTTIVAGATLQLGYNGATSGSVLGDIVDNGSLVFNHSASTTFSGGISGVGSLTIDGPGTLMLAGVNSYTGGTTVNGWLEATNPLPGNVTVSNFGTLQEVPRVDGDLSNSGDVRVQGGDTTVGGNYTQISGGVDHGTLAVSLGSKLAVTGTATLNGGTLEVTGADSGYVANTHTDVLTATGGVTGTFDQLVKDSGVVFTSTTIGYGSNDVYLDTTGLNITVAAKAMGIVEPAAISAAQRVQDGFEAINATMASGGAPSSDVLQGAGAIQHSATPAVAQATLTSLSGQLHAASTAMLFDGIDARNDALSGHFDDLVSNRAKSGVWYSNLGWQGNLQRGSYAGATFRSDGGMAGVDVQVGQHALLGVAAGQSLGFGQLDASWDHNRTWMNNIAMYGGVVNGPWHASAQIANGWYREDMQRLLQLGALGSPVGASSAGHYVAGVLEGGRSFNVHGVHFEPFADVRYQRLDMGGFTEQGGLGYGLKAEARSAGRLQTGLGLRVGHGWRLANGMRMEFDGRAGWHHTLHQYGDVFDASFTGFNDWLPLQGIGLSRNTAILRAGLSWWPSRNFALRLGYLYEQDQQARSGSAMLQGTVAF